ncbi:MAG: hypothetical protein KTR31_24805 [Myxococcales bacterium]|nr:hypothetical protein [Myxococcales bacterium]
MTVLWLSHLAMAGITFESPPLHGAPTVVVVADDDGRPRAGETVRVVHRPGLSGEQEQAIGITDGRGRVRWTPAVPGRAEVRAGQEPLEVRVAWARAPLGTVLLLVLCALAGIVALGHGLRRA